MIGCTCDFEYNNAADYDDYYEEEFHAKHHGCICEWSMHNNGYNEREERPNCPFHKVMY